MPAYYDFEEWELTDEDVERYGLWVCNYKETIPPWKPLNLYQWQLQWQHALEYGPELIALPGSHGWPLRQKNGYQYCCVALATEEEKKQREPIFRQRMVPWIEDPMPGYNRCISAVSERYEQHKKVDLEALSDIELVQEWEEAWLTIHKMCELHMDVMFPILTINGLFLEQLKELLGIDDTDLRVKRLYAGRDNAIFRRVEEQWRLARRAIELGLGGLFETLAGDELLSQLEQKDAGRKWLEEYRSFLWQHGWRTERRMDFSTPAWIEKPSLGIPDLKIAVFKDGVYTLGMEREQLAKEREEAEKELLSKVPEARREMLERLMKGAEIANWWIEDHTYWFDEYAYAIVRRVSLEMGKRFAQTGVIDDPEDFYFLIPSDIVKAQISRFRSPLHHVVEKRKKQWGENLKIEPEPFYGNFDHLGEWMINDPPFRVIASPPVVKPELKANFYGSGSAPGLTEGTARVIITIDEASQIQPSEILVTPSTTAPWTPVFSLVKAVVTEAGGTLSHPVIVAREYGIPAVAGCMEATKKIKTGDRLRVDGDNCCVYILESK